MRNIVDAPQLEKETADFVEGPDTTKTPVVLPKPFTSVTKMVRQPNVDIAVDPILAQVIRDYEMENENLQKQFAENTRARNRAIAKILTMNALQLRVNCTCKWLPGTDILSVPVPDVVTKTKEEE